MQNDTLPALYKKLHMISLELLDNFTDENVVRTIEYRGEILKRIEYLAPKTFNIDTETRAVMAKIIEIDKVLVDKINLRMGAIKSEINSMYSKSRAAVAYTANKK